MIFCASIVLTMGTAGIVKPGTVEPHGEDQVQIESTSLIGPLQDGNQEDCPKNEPLVIRGKNSSINASVTRNCEVSDTPIITIRIDNNKTGDEPISGRITAEVVEGDAEPVIVAVPLFEETPQPDTETTLPPITEQPSVSTPIEETDERTIEDGDRSSSTEMDTLLFETSPKESPDFIEVKFNNTETREIVVVVRIDSSIGVDAKHFRLVVKDPGEEDEDSKNDD